MVQLKSRKDWMESLCQNVTAKHNKFILDIVFLESQLDVLTEKYGHALSTEILDILAEEED